MILDFAYDIYGYARRYRFCRFLAAIVRRLFLTILSIRVPTGFINSDYNAADLDKNREILDRWEKEERKIIKSMTWFIPAFSSPHAGLNNIFAFLAFFLAKGTKINTVLLGSALDTSYCHYLIRKRREFACLQKTEIFKNPQIYRLPYTDAGIATRCDTAYSLLKYNNTKSKFYFIQDDERLLYQDKAKSDLAGATYRFGFIGITNAEALKEMYDVEFGGRAESYFPAPAHIKPVETTFNREIGRVFFYARPEPDNSRNGFALGIAGLKGIKKRHPEVEIATAGSGTKFNDYGLMIKQFGQLPYSQLPEFYSRFDVGIYILLSKHTGVIPFELMASGCAVLTNKRHYKQSYLRHMENCIMFDLTPSSIADAFDTIYHDRKLHQQIVANGLKFIKEMPTLEEEINRIYQFMIT